MIKVGIIGTGGIATTSHGPAIRDLSSTELTAVLSRDSTKGQEFAKNLEATDANIHTQLDSFIADSDIDLAVIASPDKLHAEQAAACLDAGKHVLLEKPLATNSQDSADLVAIAAKNNRILATGFHHRSHTGHIKLKSLIQDKDTFGDIIHIRLIWAISFRDDTGWRASRDLGKWWSLAAVGSHCLDLARWLTDDNEDWQSISSTTTNDIWNGPHDETAIVSGQLKSGPSVNVTSSVIFGSFNRIEIFGTRNRAICTDTFGRHGGGEIMLGDEPIHFDQNDPFVTQLFNVVGAIKGTTKLTASGEVGHRSVQDLLLAMDV